MPAARPEIVIVPYADLAPDRIESALDAVFFEASATASFASDAARAAFRWRWLGRYLEQTPGSAFVALGADAQVAGYLVGSMLDPAHDPAQSDLGYVQDFAPLSARFPAHLHINLAPPYRSGGIGARLIEAFAAHAALQGAPGVHVITAKGMRNVGFYERNGFAALGEAECDGRSLLFLARKL